MQRRRARRTTDERQPAHRRPARAGVRRCPARAAGALGRALHAVLAARRPSSTQTSAVLPAIRSRSSTLARPWSFMSRTCDGSVPVCSTPTTFTSAVAQRRRCSAASKRSCERALLRLPLRAVAVAHVDDRRRGPGTRRASSRRGRGARGRCRSPPSTSWRPMRRPKRSSTLVRAVEARERVPFSSVASRRAAAAPRSRVTESTLPPGRLDRVADGRRCTRTAGRPSRRSRRASPAAGPARAPGRRRARTGRAGRSSRAAGRRSASAPGAGRRAASSRGPCWRPRRRRSRRSRRRAGPRSPARGRRRSARSRDSGSVNKPGRATDRPGARCRRTAPGA